MTNNLFKQIALIAVVAVLGLASPSSLYANPKSLHTIDPSRSFSAARLPLSRCERVRNLCEKRIKEYQACRGLGANLDFPIDCVRDVFLADHSCSDLIACAADDAGIDMSKLVKAFMRLR